MKDKVMDALQRFSKAMFIPVLILPIAGILIAVGNLFTNVRLQAVLPFLNNPVTIGFGTLLSGSLNAILGNLGVIFCVGLSVGLANKKKSEAGFISLLALWWPMYTTASARLSSTTPSRSTAAPVSYSSC